MRIGGSDLKRLVSRVALPAAAVLGLVLGAPALAAGSTLKLHGPTSNKLGANFNYTISGAASGPANYVVAWEQFIPGPGCASTYAAESTRDLSGNNFEITMWRLETPGGFGATGRVASGSHYSFLARFGAANAGKHGICAYLINLATGNTYADAGAFWVNHH